MIWMSWHRTFRTAGRHCKCNKRCFRSRLVFSTGGADRLIFKKGPEDGLEKLGFTANDNRSNRISLTTKLDSLSTIFKNDLNIADPDANVVFTINGQTIDVGKTYANATLSDVMNAINSSSAGVKITYDSLNDSLLWNRKLWERLRK